MKTLLAGLLFTSICGSAMADFTTLSLPPVAYTNAVLIVPSNTVAQVMSTWMSAGASCTMNIHGVAITAAPPAGGFTFTGPGSVTLTNSGNGPCLITVQTYPATAPAITNTPSTAVVIPNDTAGPVTIILESSTDLVNWTAALPGTYGTTASNRFFRVRASR